MGKNRYLCIIKQCKGVFDVIEDGFEYFLEDLMDEEYVSDFLENLQYRKAIIYNGKINFDVCFGYSSLLVLRGSEKLKT